MRIFFVTNNYTPYSGGVVQSITAITDALRKQGHQVFIITLDFLGKKDNEPDYVIRIACPVKFKYKQNYMAAPWRPIDAINKLIEQYKPDIIHVHHPFLLGTSALRAARKHNIPCVFTHHTLYEEYAHYVPLPPVLVKPLIRTMVLQFCTQVDAIIAPSTHVKEYLLSHHIATPVTVISSPLRELFTEKKLLPSKKQDANFFDLLFVGRFVPEKNIPFLFEVMHLLPDNFRLTLVGYGSDEEKLKTIAFKTIKNTQARVQFIHKPEDNALLERYRNADLFIFPSHTDTQGIVLAESMSQGVPVIALDGPGQRDSIKNNINGFIIKDAADAAEKIITIAHNPLLQQTLCIGAHTTAQQYHAQCVVEQLVTMYQNLC
jgi:1,2-diacylglycerol 3-alpha-glucosyltransferase